MFDFKRRLLQRKMYLGRQKVAKRPSPGTWRRILKQHRKRPACLFWDTDEKGSKPPRAVTEQNFFLIASSTREPTETHYDEDKKCLLCKTNLGTHKKGIRRCRHRLLDLNFSTNVCGYMVTKAGSDLYVHALCMDYGYGKNLDLTRQSLKCLHDRVWMFQAQIWCRIFDRKTRASESTVTISKPSRSWLN